MISQIAILDRILRMARNDIMKSIPHHPYFVRDNPGIYSHLGSMLHILLKWPNSQPKPSGLYNKDSTQPCLDRKKDVPGTVVVVVDKHGEEKFTSASDTCCCGTTEKMTLDNIFWIPSCTKMIVGIACMQLIIRSSRPGWFKLS